MQTYIYKYLTFYLENNRRILSNTRDKLILTTQFPQEVSDVLQKVEWDIEISNIKSKKLFDLCQRFAQNSNSSWSEQTSDMKLLSNINEVREKLGSLNSISLNNKRCDFTMPIIKHKPSPYNTNTFAQKLHIDLKSWKSKPKNFKSKYSWIYTKIKEIIENNRKNKMRLITFNPSKIRVKSPPIPRARRLIEENKFSKVYQIRQIINL